MQNNNINKKITKILKSENKEESVKKIFGSVTDEELFEMYKVFKNNNDISVSKLIFDELLKNDLNKEMIKKILPYIDCSLIQDYNISFSNFRLILKQLIIYGCYEKLFSIMNSSNLGEKYFEYVINYILLLEKNSNDVLNSKNADNLFKLLYTICYLDSLRQFDFDTDSYKEKIEEEIIKTGDEKNIIKTGIYIDKYLLSNIFMNKSSLLEYLLLNEYDDEEIKIVIEKFYSEDEKLKINHKVSKNIDLLDGNIPVNTKDRFESNTYLSLKYIDK